MDDPSGREQQRGGGGPGIGRPERRHREDRDGEGEGPRERLLGVARRRSFADGARIQGRERVLRRVCVIADGHVRFGNVTPDGAEIDTIVLEPGQSFGEITTFAGRPPPHEAYAVGTVRLDVVDWSALQANLAADRAIADTLLKAMASTLMDALEALDDIRSLPPKALLAKHLLHSTSMASNRLAMSQARLAALLGCSRSTLSKAVQALAAAGAVRIAYGAIEIVDVQSLRDFAQVSADGQQRKA